VLGPAVAVIAGVQTSETMKLLLGARDRVLRGLLRYDAWEADFTTVRTGSPRPDCPACGARDFMWLEGRAGARAARLCGRDAIQLLPRGGAPPGLDGLAERLRGEWSVTVNEYLLRARRDGVTLHVFRDGRVIVEGITDEARARSLVARTIGV
jgi:adenylyltransferase/sulfurtransferase